MADTLSPDGTPLPVMSFDFIENSGVTYFVPLETDFDIDQVVKTSSKGPGAVFEAIECRESLFFDELVHVFFALKTSSVEEEVFRTYLKRLVISLEAQIANSGPSDKDTHPPTEVIYSGSIESADAPVSLFSQEEGDDADDESEAAVYAVWKLPVLLNRPRMRLQAPSVVFHATASLRPADVMSSANLADGYLKSGVPSGLNLLASLGGDPDLQGVEPRLSALRVSRVAPLTQRPEDLLRPLRSHPKQLSFPVYPILHSRVRFARPNTTPPSAAVIAMLEVDFTPFFDCEVALSSISLSVPEGTVEDLTSQSDMALPLSCVAHDHVTFLHRIAPNDDESGLRDPSRELGISVSATVLVHPGVCTPQLKMAWTAPLDFTLPVNAGFGSVTQPLQRAHRPSQLSIGSMTSFTAPAVSRPDALPSFEEAATRTEAPVPDLGITMTFSGPPLTQKIRAGETFVWTIFVVNRSPPNTKAPPRKLALVAIPKRRRNDNRVNRPPSVSHSAAAHATAKTPRDHGVADAVLDDNVVHAMQRSSAVDDVEMVCLSADVRVGPLAPGACHVAELRFLALKTGVVGIEAVRVVDLSTTEHIDIRDLPTVVVEEAAHAGSEDKGGSGLGNDRLVAAAAA